MNKYGKEEIKRIAESKRVYATLMSIVTVFIATILVIVPYSVSHS